MNVFYGLGILILILLTGVFYKKYFGSSVEGFVVSPPALTCSKIDDCPTGFMCLSGKCEDKRPKIVPKL